ncbi:MAG TPA: chloride channel protein [Cyclobacteriaceae bacterium]|nr:chloride channel protein [Cyclobacteriaceae bacterium]
MMKLGRKAAQIINVAPSWIIRKISNKQFLIAGAVIVGLWAGLTAVLLKISVHYLHGWLHVLGQHYNWIYFVSPGIGILATYVFIELILKGNLLKGTSHVLFSIARKSSILPRSEIFSHAVTSALTVGLGGSAGLESPIVQTGSAIGSTFASFFPVGYRDRTLLLACGAAAGIATAFNAPIAGVLFALEVLLVDVSISAFIPLLIAGATGALCSKIILNENILLSFKQAGNFNYYNVPLYILLGILCGLISVFYIQTFVKLEIFFSGTFKSKIVKLIVGASLLGGVVILFPALFGEGYNSITLLANQKPEELFRWSILGDFILQSPWIIGISILIISLIKVFAVSLTLNAGGNGGNFAPALFVGACLGFSFAFLMGTSGLANVPTSNFCLVAMAGVLTGIFHAPLTGVFLIAELTGGYELMIPLMIVSAISAGISRYLNPRSLDEEKLSISDSPLSLNKDSHVLSELSLKAFIEKDFITVPLGSTLQVLVDSIARSKRNIFPVVDGHQKLMGVIALEDIREIMFNSSVYNSVLVDKLMRKPIVTVSVYEEMGVVMEKFDKTGVWNIPVLDGDRYIGFVSKSRIFSNYREKLRDD